MNYKVIADSLKKSLIIRKKNLLSALAAIGFATAGVAQTVPNYVPTSGLVGYWGFDGNANDYSGNGNHGTVYGATLTTDRNGSASKAYNFDGASNYISVPDNNSLDLTNKYTISAWINIPDYSVGPALPNGSNATDVARTILGKPRNSGWATGYDFQTSPTGQTTTLYSAAGNMSCCPNTSVMWNSAPALNIWYHIVAVYDGTTLSLYVNGTFNNSTQSTFTLDNSSEPLYIGKEFTSVGLNWYRWYKGKIDDIGIWNRALTQQEVTALYNSGQTVPSYVPTNGLVGWWPFNGNANDESGNGNNGTVNGATLTTDRSGNANKAYSFNGIDNRIDILYNGVFHSNMGTVNAWIKSNGSFQEQKLIIGQSSGRPQLVAHADNSSIPHKAAVQWIATNGAFPYATSSSDIDNGSWTMITGVYTNNLFKIYVNGKLENSSTTSLTPEFCSTYPIQIGGFYNNNPPNGCHYFQGYSQMFKGLIDDVGFWNRNLTDQEITALYNSGQSAISSSTITVDAPTTAKQNDTVQVAINTTALNAADGVISYQANLAYDATRLTYLSHSLTGTLHNGGTEAVNATTTGTVNLSYMTTTALSGTGSLIKFKFLAKNVLGKAPFKLSDFLYNTTAINQLTQDTVTIIDGIPPTAKIKYSANPVRKADSLLITVTFNEKMASSPLPQLKLSGVNTKSNQNLSMVNDTVFTYWHVVEKGNGAVNVLLATGKDLAGNTLVANPTSGSTFSVLPIVYGDIDTNKVVQAYDAALALQYSVKLNPLPTIDPLPWSNWRVAVANVDTVGDVTANDAALILRYSAKIINTFPGNSAVRRTSKPTNSQVIVTQEGSDLMFRATGSLIGLNVFVSGDYTSLGTPVVLDNNMLVATNIDQNNYAIGLATAYETPENQPFMKIPLKSNSTGTYTIELVVNDAPTPQTVGTVTAIKINAAVSFGIYPNPTKDVLSITKAIGHTVKIYDLNGKEVFTQEITSNQFDISMKQVGAKGIYFVQLTDAKQHVLQSQKIILE